MKSIIFTMLIVFCMPLFSADDGQLGKARVEYSTDPGNLLVSFHQIFPELADQDPTPLIRIYGNGRVVVFHPTYMKRAGRYEMVLSKDELESLLLELTPALINFDAHDIQRQKKNTNEFLRSAAGSTGEVTVYYHADAEISVFYLNVEIYQPEGLQGETIYTTALQKTWRGLRFDARDYPGIESIQALMRAEQSLRALTTGSELTLVERAP